MAARAGMVNLVGQMRAVCNVGSADYSVAGVSWWTDDQLQLELDRTRSTYQTVFLERMPIYKDTLYQYFDYGFPDACGKYFEEYSAAGDAGMQVRDYRGSALANGTAYTVNYVAGIVTFPTNQAGSVYYLDVRSYDLYRAAAQVWRWKAANVYQRIDWKSDNHDMKASQEYDHCIAMADYCAKQAGVKASVFFRTDER